MAQAKYKALKAFDDFNPGDDVAASKVGDRADLLISEGFIALSESETAPDPAPPQTTGTTSDTVTGTTGGVTLGDAQSVLNAQVDTEQRTLLGPYATPVASNLVNLAGTIDGALLNEPPAVIGQAVTAANTESAMKRTEEAAKKLQPLAVGNTLGDAEEVGGAVTVADGSVQCPNCKRVWREARMYTGSTIPCPCGYLIEVAV